jgi:hypothetical protein
MQTRGRLIPLGILVIGILSVATVVTSQAPQNVWEYASVSGDPRNVSDHAEAKICYATVQGCRFEDISVKGIIEAHKTEGVGLMAAAAKLGTQGWEFTSSTDISNSSVVARVMYFRRLNSK